MRFLLISFLIVGCGRVSASADPENESGSNEPFNASEVGSPAPSSEQGAPSPVCTGRSDISTVEAHEKSFLATWDDELNEYGPASRSKDSWQFYNLGYAVSANASMFEATGKRVYLDRALLYVRQVMADAVPSRSLPRSSYQDDYLGWAEASHPQIDDHGDEYPLYESYLWRYVTTTLRLMKSDAAIMADEAYAKDFATILAFTEKHLFEKWMERNPDHIYRVNTHMTSHWARICMNLFVLTGDEKYRRVLDWHNEAMRRQLQTHPLDAGGYFWNDAWDELSQPGQDVSHGNADIAFITESHELGFEWTSEDMGRFVRTLSVVWPREDAYADFIDGSGDGNGWFTDGFLTLGRFDVALQKRLEKHDVGRSSQFYGTLALNARRLGACAQTTVTK